MPFECAMCMEFLNCEAPPDSAAVPPEEDCETTSPGPSHKGLKKNKKTKPEDLKKACVTPCGHMFHRTCLDRWFSKVEGRRKNCPSCRKPVAVSRVQQLKPTGATKKVEPDNTPTPPDCGIDECQCHKDKCNSLFKTHGNLISEYEAIQENMPDKYEELAILGAKFASLEEEGKHKQEELGSLASFVKTKKEQLVIDLTESQKKASASSSTVVSCTHPCCRSTTAQRAAAVQRSPCSSTSGSAPSSSSSPKSVYYSAQSSVSDSPDLLLEVVASKRSKRVFPRHTVAKKKK